MTLYDEIARATFRIECGNSSGSGFVFKRDSIIITNNHVIKNHIENRSEIYAVTESGERTSTKLISSSDEYDYAILEITGEIPDNIFILQPETSKEPARGTSVIFSGFPHGIHKLLVHKCVISGVDESVFYVDGSVNPGNSGGPIIDFDTGHVVGIVTMRRFLGAPDLQDAIKNFKGIEQYCIDVSSSGQQIVIGGIKLINFFMLLAQRLNVISSVLEANANTGIGIGYRIQFVDAEVAD
ncbi:serine protease [Acidithiobacillus sp.]|jgi:hypothetical protein|uniref:S1 family peptidase n=1 Tax=Acidithiobacillus sp. TaxID=1872118 RepID=UPI00356857CD